MKSAYRHLARSYHDGDGTLPETAQAHMKEINDAYDAIIRERRQFGGRGKSESKTGGSQYADVRALLSAGRYADAETVLDGVPVGSRDAEWYFLKGQVLYRKGWLEDAYSHYEQACRMDPQNTEYRYHFNRMQSSRRGHDAPGCSPCEVCGHLMCADCCCECMGGDLIRCC